MFAITLLLPKDLLLPAFAIRHSPNGYEAFFLVRPDSDSRPSQCLRTFTEYRTALNWLRGWADCISFNGYIEFDEPLIELGEEHEHLTLWLRAKD